MKKSTILKITALSVVTLAFVVNVNSAQAASAASNALKNAVKQDIQAVKKDAQAQSQARQDARNSAASAKKAEKIKEIDVKIADLNKEMAATKANKNITETERTLKVRSLQRQIDFYNKQKEALK